MSNGWERFKAEQEQRGTAGSPAGASRSGNNGFAEYQRRSAQRQSGQSGSSRSWQRYLWETQGIRPTVSDKDVYKNSGMAALRGDVSSLTGGLRRYFQNDHSANAVDPQYRQKTRAMLDAIANERKYFDYYKDSFTAEDLQKYTAELDEYEAQLKAYDGYFGNGYGRATDKNSAIWGSGYSALSSGLTSFDKDVRGLMQGGRVVTDEAKTDLQRKQQALSSRLSATKRYMEQNAALFTPQERKQWQDEFSQYESYLNGVGSYLTSGQLGTTNPFTGKTVPVPNGGLTLEQDRQQREAVQQKITDVIDSFSNAGKLGITAKNAQQEAQTAQDVVQRATRKRERLTAQRAEMEQQLKAIPDSEWQARNALVQQMQDVDTQIDAQRHTIETYTERGKVAQDVANAGDKYDEYRIGSMVQEALNAPDFAEKSKPQEGVYSYTVDNNVNVRLALSDDYDLSDATHIQNPEYGYINGTDEDRSIIINQYAVHNAERDQFASYGYLTDKEKGVFNYLWATKGRDTAMEYLAALKPTLDYRNGAAMAQNSPGSLWGNVVSPMVRGFQGAMRNTEALLQGGRELPISPGEYETAIRRENAGEWGRHIIDASTSFGQMLPAMTISLATGNPTAGAAVTFVTSGAGAYQEGLRSGMTEGQALGYGALVGGAEGFLQAVAGGIPGLKGVLPEAVGGQIAGKINNAFGRWAVKFGANIASEVLEENVQNYLEPLFVTMLTGRDYEAPGWEEFVDTTLSTLLLTGATNLATAGSTLKNERAEVEQIKAAQAQFALAALSFDESSPVYAMGEKVAAALDNKKFLTGQEFRAMLQEAGADQATVDRINKGAFTAEDAEQVAQMAQEAAKRLQTERFEQSYTEGAEAWSKERASAAAEVLYRVWNGENVRNADIQKLHLNTKKGAEALQNALGVPVKKAGNNNVAANQTFREAEMSYRMARSTAKYGEAEINWKTLPPTQESADAIMVHPEAKTALEEIRNKPFTGTYAEQTRQIMQQLSIWWAANASRFTPEAASIQVERWRAEHPQENAQFNIDNAENSGYTGENGGVSNERDRMAGGMAEGVPGHEDYRRRDAGGRQDGRTNQVFSGRGLSQSLQRAFEQSGVVATELYNFDADSAAFSTALEAARTADTDHGWAVTPQSVEDLQGKTLLMDEGGTIGFAVTADGDIEAVFKNKQLNHTRFAMDGVMPQAIAAGGVKLDCYGRDLVRIYERYGFTPVARVEFNEQYANPGWDTSKGTPYIYFMVHNGDSAETVAANIGKYPHMERSQLESLPTYGKEGYDQAAAQRDSLLSWRQQRQQQGQEYATTSRSNTTDGGTPNRTETAPTSEKSQGKGRQVIYNTLKNSEVFGGVFQDVYDELVSQDPDATRYDVVHEMESMYNAAQRVQNDPYAEAARLTEENGHEWSGEDIDTAMGLIAKFRSEGNFAAANDLAVRVARAGTQMGQSIQAFAKWSRTPTGIATDAIARLNDGTLSNKRVQELTRILLDSADVVEKVQSGAGGTDEAKSSLIETIRTLARTRNTVGVFSHDVSSRLMDALAKQDIDTLASIAKAQIQAVPQDLTTHRSLAETASAARALFQLSNLTTPIANIVGNGMHDLIDTLATNIAVPIDKILSRVTGQRTVSVDKGWFSSAKRKGAIDGATRSYIEVALDVNLDNAETRYGTSSKRTFKMTGNVLERFLSRWEKYQGFALTTTDEFSKGGIRAESMRGMGKLLGNGADSVETREHLADLLAKERTFQQDSKLAEATTKLKNLLNIAGISSKDGAVTIKMDNGQKITLDRGRLTDAGYRAQVVKRYEGAFTKDQITQLMDNVASGAEARFGVGNILMNYPKVAANLADIQMRYTAGGVVGVASLFKTLAQKQNVSLETQRNVSMNIARNVTGASMIAGFAALAAKGILMISGAGGDDDDKKRSAQRGVQGISDGQLNLSALFRWISGDDNTELQDGDYLIEVSFLQPLYSMMATGAMIAESDETGWKKYASSISGGAFQSVLDTPGFEGVQNFIDEMSYSDAEYDGNKLAEALAGLFIGDVASAVPGPVRALAKATDPNYRELYTSGNMLGEAWDQFRYNIPILRQTLPVKKDAYGNDKVYPVNTALRWANAFLLPGKVAQYQTTDVSDEAERLYSETGISVYPSVSTPRVISWTTASGEKKSVSLDSAQRVQFRENRGSAYNQMCDEMMNNEVYRTLSDDEKAAACKELYRVAGEYAKEMANVGYTSEDKLVTLSVGTRLPITEAYAAKLYHKGLETSDLSANVKMADFDNWVSHRSWTDAQKKAVLEAYGSFSTTMRGDTDRYDELTEYIGKDKALTVVDGVGKLEPIGDAKQVSDAQRIRAIAKMPLSDQEKWDAFAVYRDDDWRIAFFRKAEINPSVYAAYLEAAPEYRLTADGKKSSAWNKTTIWNWLRTTEYSYAVRQKVAQIALMDKPKEDGKK